MKLTNEQLIKLLQRLPQTAKVQIRLCDSYNDDTAGDVSIVHYPTCNTILFEESYD